MNEVELKSCVAKWNNGGIDIYNLSGEYLGSICGNDPRGDWELIKAGHDPIEEKWEDGSGHTCVIEGWKNEQ